MNEQLTHYDQDYFKQWIDLNLPSISWEGRYLEEFNQFWQHVFKDDIAIDEQFKTLNNILVSINEGPVISWIRWIREKLICYVFVYKDLDLKTIARLVNMQTSEVSTICRDFFIERFPHLEEEINDNFQIGNMLSPNLNQTFTELKEKLGIDDSIRGSVENEIMKDLEITLYSEWGKLKDSLIEVKDPKTKKVHGPLPVKKSQTFKFFSELLILFIVGALLILGIKLGNNLYENYLIKNISLFEPNFLELETNLSFKAEKNIERNDLGISMDELEALEKIESKEVFTDAKEENRYEVETDVVLTSVDSLPKDFDIADLEQSNYEEVKKGGYRNSQYGRRKAYRVMMTSVDANITKDKLSKILGKYKVQQVDNVKPGTEIPGGVYFNIYVPRGDLKDFIYEVSSLEQATILESRTRTAGGPQGSDKVFIWIKQI